MTRRVAFTFDDPSYLALYELSEQLGSEDMAETIRVALVLLRTLEQQRDEGYTEITLRNPKTGQERTVTVRALEVSR